jgi:hypothetical protein
VRPQKLPRAEAGVRKRKMAAVRQAVRRTRLCQAEKDTGVQTERGKGKGKEKEEEEKELEDAEALEGDLVEVGS